MNEKLIGYARLVAIAAAQNQLGEETAIVFCRDAVPQLLAELEVLGRVNQKFEVALGLAVPIVEEAAKPALRVVAAPARKARKSRKKKARSK
jgi:hypothetical protein